MNQNPEQLRRDFAKADLLQISSPNNHQCKVNTKLGTVRAHWYNKALIVAADHSPTYREFKRSFKADDGHVMPFPKQNRRMSKFILAC